LFAFRGFRSFLLRGFQNRYQLDGTVNVFLLIGLVAPAQRNHKHGVHLRDVNAIACAKMLSELSHTGAYCLAIAPQTRGQLG
jgi:hypothetical protein